MSREMKDSGYEWLGCIPNDWKLQKGKYLFSQKNDRGNTVEMQLLSPTQNYGVIPQSLYEELSGFNAVKLNERVDLSQLKTVHKGAYVISLRSFQGGFEYSEYEGVVSPAYQVFYPIVNIDDRYYKYFFKTQAFIDKMNSYTMSLRDGKNIAFKDFGDTYILYPSVFKQHRIADFLDSKCSQIDEISKKIQEEIDTLEEYKKSVITEAVTKGLDPNVEMKDSGISWCKEIPAHWEVVPSKYLFRDSDQRRKLGDLQLTASQRYGIISQEEYMKREKTQVVVATQGLEKWKHIDPNDFVISLRSFQGGLEISTVSGCITWHYVILKNTCEICYDYFKWLFKSSAYIEALQRTCNFIRDGQDLRFSNFCKVPLFKIPLEEQAKIADYLNTRNKQIENAIKIKRQQLSTLEEYKKSLIYEYVTGKKEVAYA